MKKLLLIDTFNFLHRAYHALPNTFRDREGSPVNAVYGVASMLINVFDVIRPDYAIAALDDISPTLRSTSYTGYKAQRKPMEEDLSSQIPKVFDIIDAFGIHKLSVPGYEADDIIGTFATHFSKENEIIIVSNDHDLWQLLNDRVLIMYPSTKGYTEWIGEKEVFAKMGFPPKHIIDYKGLKGDPSDNIPGVFGIGEKTAKELIEKFGDVDNIYKNIDKISSERTRNKLLEGYEQAKMSKNLATIVTDVPVSANLEDCCYTTFNKLKVKEILEKYNFKSLITRLGFEIKKDEKSKKENKQSDGQLSLI